MRQEQIDENIKQGNEICDRDMMPNWVCGDALDSLEESPDADFIFSCPPYGDLEVYSKDERDLSNMTKEDFLQSYEEIVDLSVNRLKNNRFACFVVGNYRDKDGVLIDLVGETVHAFEKAGASFYNDMILVNSTGSLPIRITKQFSISRKIGKHHQYVLVFVKGDPKKAARLLNRRPIQGDPNGTWKSPGQEEMGFGFV